MLRSSRPLLPRKTRASNRHRGLRRSHRRHRLPANPPKNQLLPQLHLGLLHHRLHNHLPQHHHQPPRPLTSPPGQKRHHNPRLPHLQTKSLRRHRPRRLPPGMGAVRPLILHHLLRGAKGLFAGLLVPDPADFERRVHVWQVVTGVLR